MLLEEGVCYIWVGGSSAKESACSAETWVQSLDQENSLEQEMANHGNVLAWRIPWTE